MEVKGSSSSSSFRWTPTREQLAILEAVYRDGIRTPSTEQIQEMTRRLRQFGEIEGKNVFYWFQNHKARQRQKIKQEEKAAILSRLYRSQPMPPILTPHPPPFYHQYRPDVVYAPYCVAMPQPSVGCGYYHQTQVPNAFLPAPIKAVPKKQVQLSQSGFLPTEFVANEAHETLQLFPLQPSGILLEEGSRSSVTSSSAEEGEECEGEGGSENLPFFDFFGPSQGN